MTTALLGFAAASTLLILAPGPDSLLVVRNTVRGGRTAGWVTACGTLSGLTIWALAAALGLSALLRVSQAGYDILRFAGAAYLIWLGVTSLGVAGPLAAEQAKAGRPEPDEVPRPGEPQHVVADVADPHQRGQAKGGGQRPDRQAGHGAARGDQPGPAAAAHGVAQDQQAVRAGREDQQRRREGESKQCGGHRFTLQGRARHAMLNIARIRHVISMYHYGSN